MLNLKNKRVLVTGPKSMIGRSVCEKLRERGADVFECYKSVCDLTNEEETLKTFLRVMPDYVFHVAGHNGGIQFNRDYPEEIFRKTVLMGLNVFHASTVCNVEKVVSIISVCAYPDCELFEESTFWDGKPNQSVECHGFAKRFLDAYGRQIALDPNLNTKVINVILTNCYGEYDRFDDKRGKVVSSLIYKFDKAQKNGEDITCWGTGQSSRDLMYREDAAECLIQAFEKYDDPMEPINVGTFNPIKIKDLVNIIAEEMEFTGQVLWDSSKGDGQLKREMSNKKMKEYINHSFVDIRDGVRKTVKWYKEQHD